MLNEHDAKNYIMPFGKYFSETLDHISRYYPFGVRDLDKILGDKNIDLETKKHLEVFLKLPHISKLLDEQLESLGHDDEPEENYRIPKPWYEKD